MGAIVLLALGVQAPGSSFAQAHGDGTVYRFRAQAWWLDSYAALLATLEQFPQQSWEGTVETSTGPPLRAELSVGAEEGLLLVVEEPTPAVDLESQRSLPGQQTIVTMWIRDRNLDGTPDAFKVSPFRPLPGERVLEDGWVQLRDAVDHAAALRHWHASVGQATRELVGESGP